MFKKVTIIGVGLIGGSIGLALKKKKLAKNVWGVGRRTSSIKKAIKKRAIDKGTLNLKTGIKDADLIIIATSVSLIMKYLNKLKKIANPGCVITDVGSTKGKIVLYADKVLGESLSFVGGHPLSGSEKGSVEFASVDLFKNSKTILTKTKKTNQSSLKKVRRMWEKIGAKCFVLSPTQHDKVVAQISHLPHIVAACLVNSTSSTQLMFAAGGFKDATRIASSDFAMWRDIILTNKGPIKAALKGFDGCLKELLGLDAKGMSAKLNKAKAKRDNL